MIGAGHTLLQIHIDGCEKQWPCLDIKAMRMLSSYSFSLIEEAEGKEGPNTEDVLIAWACSKSNHGL